MTSKKVNNQYDICYEKYLPIESGLVGRVVEHLQELGAAQVVHELRVQAEVL